MFERIRKRLADMRALSVLMSSADKFSGEMADGPPGAEHLLLAALEHPDGSARRVFERFGVTLEATRVAIERQYADALRSIGLDDGGATEDGGRRDVASACAEPPATFYTARESGRALLDRMAARQGRQRFESARTLEAVADVEHGVAARTLRVLGIDADELRAAVADEIEHRQGVGKGI